MLKQYFQLPKPVLILCLGTFVNRAGSFFVVFLTIYLSKRLGYEITFATWCMGAFGVGSVIASLVGGQLADLIGRRIVMLISLVGGAAVLAVFGHLQSKTNIIGAVFAFALTIDMYRPAASAMIGDLVSPDQRPHAFGLMYVAINLGFAFGAAVGGEVATRSYIWLFRADALTTLAYAAIIAVFIRETLPAGRRDEGGAAGTTTVATVPTGETASRILRDWPFVLFCLGALLSGLVFMQSMTTLPIHMASLGFPADEYGYVISINGILIVLLQLPFTAYLSQFNRMSVIVLGGVCLAVGFGLTGMAEVPWQFAATVALWTVGEMMQAPFAQAVITDLAPVELRARYMGVFSMCFALSLMLGAPIGGQVLSRCGPNYLWGGSLAVGMVAVVLYGLARKPITARHAPCDTSPMPGRCEDESTSQQDRPGDASSAG